MKALLCDIESHKPYNQPNPRMTCHTHNVGFRYLDVRENGKCPAAPGTGPTRDQIAQAIHEASDAHVVDAPCTGPLPHQVRQADAVLALFNK